MSEHMALENLTVLDLTRVLAGPFCTMMLADMGANVIKIEVPKGGDDTRSYPPFRAKNLNGERESVYFANINRNKKGITLNLKAPEGKEIFKELVKKADIVVRLWTVLFIVCYFSMMALIPGRNPSVLSTGTAFTSKVFRSNCPVVLVAFQAAYVPRSFI